jgi:thiamine biosynthesis lipoprotein
MMQTRLLMGMPISVDVEGVEGVEDADRAASAIERVYAYFAWVDETFSTYKETSEISRINRGELAERDASEDVRTVLALGDQTWRETDGYFDVYRGGTLDPSGVVKGWAVLHAARLLEEAGFHDLYVDAGGDVQMRGLRQGRPWRVGIRNPFNRDEHVKTLAVTDCGVATSGTAVRGQHIYNPHRPDEPLTEIVSLTVIGPDVCEADRFATAAFAMGRKGISFIERLPGFEGYMIDAQAKATYTSGFERFVAPA